MDALLIKREADRLGYHLSVSEITDIMNAMPVSGLANYYADLIKEQHIRRRIDAALKSAAPLVMNPEQDIVELIGTIQKEIAESIPVNKNKIASVMPEIVDVWEDYLEIDDGGEPNWITTGLIDLDRQVCLANGTHTIIGASPAEGKTSLGVCILRWVSSKGKRVGMFTLEQTRRRMLQKIISQESEVSHRRFRTGRLTEEEKQKVLRTTSKWANENMCILDGKWSVDEIRLRAMQEKAGNGLDLIILDLLGLLKRPATIPATAKEHQIFNENSKQLQDLAVELDIPIITLAHLNRERYKRPGARPILSDLREAGEQYADNVIFIYREYKITQDPKYENLAELLIAKNRDGDVGKVELGWNGESTIFYNLDKHHDSPPGRQEIIWKEIADRDMKIVLGGGIQND
jgi:replicative DNA helicase